MDELVVRPAAAADREVLERLWLMFRHDMSEFQGDRPEPDGSYRSERLRAAFERTGWAAYVVAEGSRPVGFAIVRGTGEPVRVLNSFFVVRAARHAGVGLRAARDVIGRYPGPWQVAFQDQNTAAVAFWRRVAADVAGSAWTEEHRPVPGRPDLPPDTWISFRAGTADHEAPGR
jgi:predicted acetyltransferase